jgi:quercetin dioxygenase-like cupin family protein
MTRLDAGGVLASDETVHLEVRELRPGASTGLVRHPRSDAVALFFECESGEVLTSDRRHTLAGMKHAHVSAGTAYEVRNTGSRTLRYAHGLCGPGPTETPSRHDRKGSPGGVTMLGTEQYDRFPDSGLVRGGMWFLEPGASARYHSHDGAPEVFVFLKGRCEMTVEGEVVKVATGDVAYVAPEMKHGFRNVGRDRLVVWLTVTPNVTPSHTFYEQQADGTWNRVTPRLDGKPSRPPSK